MPVTNKGISMKPILQGLLLLTISCSSHAAVSYDLYQPSGQMYADDYESTFTFNPFTGSIATEDFLVINNGYYQIDINTDNISGGNLPNFSFNVSEDDILSGNTLTYYIYYNQDSPNFIGGDLIVNNLEELYSSKCIECDLIISLNLGILDYQSYGGGFIGLNGIAPNSSSPLLTYDEGSSDFNITNINELYITPVPVPASIWLFSSGLLLLIRLNKKR